MFLPGAARVLAAAALAVLFFELVVGAALVCLFAYGAGILLNWLFGICLIDFGFSLICLIDFGLSLN
ncbi:hypothetical protein [Paraburkholderia sp.]|uniref:hypothetical protein n=1 Tax=Paraburkholderia sp. TaxID=1926495 RepID=UPI002AFE9BEF|nr:hypothetical protein [Paraburkholderia sp.]